MATIVEDNKKSKFQDQEPELASKFIAEEGAEVIAEIEQLWADLDYADPTQKANLLPKMERIVSLHRQRRFKKAIKTIAVTVASAAAIAAIVIFVVQNQFGSGQQINAQIAAAIEKSAVNNDVIVYVGSNKMVAQTNTMELQTSELGTKVILNGGKNIKDIANSIERISVTVPQGKTFKLTMIDGTEINMNSESCLEYYSDFGVNHRQVTITGEAYFQVAKNRKKPFVVKVANHYSIRVLGTSFNVNDYGADSPSTTTLVKGSIEIQTRCNKKMVMSPNDQILFKPTTGDYEMQVVNTADALSWMNGMIYFDNITLQELAIKLERAFNLKIVVAEPVKNLRFSGNINRDRGIENLLRMIKSTYDINYSMENDVLLIH